LRVGRLNVKKYESNALPVYGPQRSLAGPIMKGHHVR